MRADMRRQMSARPEARGKGRSGSRPSSALKARTFRGGALASQPGQVTPPECPLKGKKEDVMRSKDMIIRAWKDPAYRAGLSE